LTKKKWLEFRVRYYYAGVVGEFIKLGVWLSSGSSDMKKLGVLQESYSLTDEFIKEQLYECQIGLTASWDWVERVAEMLRQRGVIGVETLEELLIRR
jgi:hypothetical protein